ncbi:hypothetical protein R6V09_47410 [Streptomyces sp. W16]|uniref:hypothetical protein n=1 Tax=Streptomyces sp. W16 TaxID=3076631 RepID=UPI00295BA493|nr:hypothetical protein [Streptomyces sp. W16]MDV9177737.1 hypothetical protein [Streptomyces sp. W16]
MRRSGAAAAATAAPGAGTEPAAGVGAGPIPAPAQTVSAAAAPAVRQTLRTEFPFQLPRGYVDESGTVHQDGVMRLATARDELVPLRDVRVQENPAYLSVVLLGRVITRLGSVPMVHDGIVENMFASDLAFLQDFYRQINAEGHTRAAVQCPHCAEPFEVELGGSRLGES